MRIIRFKQGLTALILQQMKDMTRRQKGLPEFEIGETLAISEAYGYIVRSLEGEQRLKYYARLQRELGVVVPEVLPSWENKLFVRPDLMIHHIQITDKFQQRLQDISDEDILREGIFHGGVDCRDLETGEVGDYTWLDIVRKKQKDGTYHVNVQHNVNSNIRDAFADMYDHICGKGSWNANPEVNAYAFKLID